MKKTDYLKIPEIIIKKIFQELSHKEQKLLDHWLSDADENLRLFNELESKKQVSEKYNDYSRIKNDAAWQKINTHLQQAPKKKYKPLYTKILRYAAILLIPLAIASVYYIYDVNKEYTLAEIIQEENPLKLKEATLILDDGRLLNLTEISPDTLKKLSGAGISKPLARINYQLENENKIDSLRFNTLLVPKARVYSIVLADGSKVWVNASSSLQFPAMFTADTRKVQLRGEAYFEVAENKEKPFIVSLDGMEVEVLGTEFNISAYKSDGLIQTTLVEGAVKINMGASEIKMQAGEQVLFTKNENSIEKKMVNTILYTSWREGKYIFEHENLENVLKKLARWHDKEIFYEDERTKQHHYTGTLKKYDDIVQSLHIISLATNIEFKVTKDAVIVKGFSKK